MNYKGQYAPSDLLDPVSYEWHPIEEFKKKFETEKFVTFSKKELGYPPGWFNPNKLTDKDYEDVYVLIGDGKIAPVIYIVNFKSSSSFKQIITDYVCSVGLELAHKMIIC